METKRRRKREYINKDAESPTNACVCAFSARVIIIIISFYFCFSKKGREEKEILQSPAPNIRERFVFKRQFEADSSPFSHLFSAYSILQFTLLFSDSV